MKIVHVLQTSLDSGQGGIANYLRNIIPLQQKQGLDVKAITNNKYSQFGEFSLPMSDFNFIGDKKFEALFHSLNVNTQLLFSDVDIIHYHFATSAFFSFIPKITGKKTILTIHGRTEVARELKKLTKSVLKIVNKKVIPKMNAITTVTPFLEKFIKEEYGCENTYLPHGFKEFQTKDIKMIKNEFGLTKDSYYLALGRLTPKKGFDTIIKAYCKKPITSKKLVIAGQAEESYEKYLKKLIPNTLKDKIIFTGCVNDEEASELYSNALLYIAGIENMGLSLTILEAIGHKTPIITSKIQGDNYKINNHTHRFENKNYQELSDLMQQLENNPQERLKFIDSGLKCARKEHSWDNISNKFLSIYNQLLENRT